MVGARRRRQPSPTMGICPHFTPTLCGPTATHPFAAGFLALTLSDPELCLRSQGHLLGAHKIEVEKMMLEIRFSPSVSPYFPGTTRPASEAGEAFCLPPSPSPADSPTCGAGSDASATFPCSCLRRGWVLSRCIKNTINNLHWASRPARADTAPPLPASARHRRHPRHLCGRDRSKLSRQHACLCCSFSLRNGADPKQVPRGINTGNAGVCGTSSTHPGGSHPSGARPSGVGSLPQPFQVG